MKKSYINIHHTAIFAENNTAEQFDAVNEAHRVRWNGKTKSRMGYYGGYHYLIERSGVIQQFRADDETGAHNNVSLMNYRAIGVCFAGNMSRQFLTDKQIESAVKLIKSLQTKHNIVDANITPHRLYKATQCPGNNIPDPVWDYLQSEYAKQEMDLEPWKKEVKKWAAQYLNDVDGFFDSPDPYKYAALLKRVYEKAKIK